MSAWQELTKIALLGTEKMPLPLQMLPETIRQQLASADPTDREALFLQAAALVRVYDRAGQKAPTLEVPNLSIAPDETQPFAPPQYIGLLKRLLDEKDVRSDLLGLFLKKMTAKNCVLTHEVLVDFLNTVCNKKFDNCHADAQKALGERGRWLAKCNVNWGDFDLGKPDLDWETLSDKQIQELLLQLRTTDPQRAFEYIEKNWAISNGRQKLAFLNVLSLQRQPSELGFFENYHEELLRGGDFKKNINRELRQLTVGMLLGNTQTALYQKAVEGLGKYVISKSKLLGLATTTTFVLPKKEDDFFNPESIAQNFGFDVTGQYRDIDYWFLMLTTFLPPFAWETLFKTTDWDKIVSIFADLKDSAGKTDSMLFKTFGMALANSQYKPAIVAFLKNGIFDKEFSFMLNVLEIKELEHFLAVKTGSLSSEKLWNNSGLGVLLGAKNQAIRPAILTEIIAGQCKIRPNWVWSRSFSLQILRGCFLTQDNLNAVEHTLTSTLFLHPSILDDLYQETRQDYGTDYYKNELRRRVISPMIQIMEFQKEIEYLK